MSHQITYSIPDEVWQEVQIQSLNYQTDPNGFGMIALKSHLEIIKRIQAGSTLINMAKDQDGETVLTELKLHGPVFEISTYDTDLTDFKSSPKSLLTKIGKDPTMAILGLSIFSMSIGWIARFILN
jgi:hypothetical protein